MPYAVCRLTTQTETETSTENQPTKQSRVQHDAVCWMPEAYPSRNVYRISKPYQSRKISCKKRNMPELSPRNQKSLLDAETYIQPETAPAPDRRRGTPTQVDTFEPN